MSPSRPLLRAALLALPLALAACGGPEEDLLDGPNDPAVPVEVVALSPASFDEVIELTGTVEAPEDARLSAETAGTLTLLAPLGTVVGRGALVAQVDPTLAQAQAAQAEAAVAQGRAAVEAAQAQLDLAEDQYRRQLPLYQDSILSALEFRGVETQRASARAQVGSAKAQLAQAEAALSQARKGLANTRITAPFGGIVEEHFATRGEQVTPGAPVVRVVATTGLRVRAGVPERYAGDVEVGTPVRVAASAYEGAPTGGRVSFAGRAVDPQSRTFPIEVQIPEDARLRPEMVVRLLVTRRTVEDALTVPLEAVQRDERGAGVFVVAQDTAGAVARRREVRLGAQTGGLVVLAEGVRAGERVIVSGQTLVSDGEPVRVTATVPARTAALAE